MFIGTIRLQIGLYLQYFRNIYTFIQILFSHVIFKYLFQSFSHPKIRYEHGVLDYPAVINFVLDQTNNTKVYVIGHSQGTTGLMTLLSERPEFNQYIAAASLLAPIAFLNNSDSFTHGFGDAVLLFKVSEFIFDI